MVHTPSSRSTSVHTAPRTSPERVAVSTRNSNASFTTVLAFDARTVSIADDTFAVRQRPHVPNKPSLRTEHRADPVARVVGPEIHRHGPFHDRADALAQLPGGGRHVVPDRCENADHVGAPVAFPPGISGRERPPRGRGWACENTPGPAPVASPRLGGSLPYPPHRPVWPRPAGPLRRKTQWRRRICGGPRVNQGRAES